MEKKKLALYILLWVASLILVFIKGSLINYIGLNLFDVDLVIIMITYLLAIHAETGAGIFALSQGLLIDIFSGGLLGLFTLLYLTLFLGINLGSRLLDLSAVRGQVIIISLAVLLKGILLIFLLNIFSFEIQVSSSVFCAFAASAVCSGLVGPFVFYLLNRLKNYLMEGTGKTSEDRIEALGE